MPGRQFRHCGSGTLRTDRNPTGWRRLRCIDRVRRGGRVRLGIWRRRTHANLEGGTAHRPNTKPNVTEPKCGKQDLNLHGITTTRPSTWRVCQFRHSRSKSVSLSRCLVVSLSRPLAARIGSRRAADDLQTHLHSVPISGPVKPPHRRGMPERQRSPPKSRRRSSRPRRHHPRASNDRRATPQRSRQ